jgi:hypothetical protein
LTGKTRKRYALFQKIMLVEKSDRLRLEQNFSIRRAGEVLGVPFPLLSKWGKEVARLRAAIQAKQRARNRKAVIDGPASQLESVEDELLQFIFSKREQGVNVKHTLVACRGGIHGGCFFCSMCCVMGGVPPSNAPRPNQGI